MCYLYELLKLASCLSTVKVFFFLHQRTKLFLFPDLVPLIIAVAYIQTLLSISIGISLHFFHIFVYCFIYCTYFLCILSLHQNFCSIQIFRVFLTVKYFLGHNNIFSIILFLYPCIPYSSTCISHDRLQDSVLWSYFLKVA